MAKLTEINIKRVVGETVYKRGLDIYLKNKIRSFDINEVIDGYYYVYADVESSSGDRVYSVTLEVEKGDELADFECECPVYYGSFHYYDYTLCKHVVAVAIKLVREKEELFRQSKIKRMQKGSDIIDAIKMAGTDIKPLKQEVNLGIIYEYEPSQKRNSRSSIELKIGTNRLYVVKNIKELLEEIKYKKKTITFGKGFTYDPETHVFSEEDQRIVDLLMELYEINDRVSEYYTYIKGPARFLVGKKAYLTDGQLKRMFSLLEGREFEAVINRYVHDPITILNEDIPLEFNLTTNDQSFVLKQQSLMPIPLTVDGEYFFYKDKIYKPSKKQKDFYIPIYNGFMEHKNNSIKFDKSLGDKVVYYVVPGLKDVSKTVTTDKYFENNFYERPIKVNMYFDKFKDYIISNVEFNYGTININPLKSDLKQKLANESGKGILIRDADTESKVLKLYEDLGFSVAKDSFAMNDEDKIMVFLSEGIKKLQEIGEVYYSESFKNIKIYKTPSFKSSISVNENDFLEFDFDIEGVNKSELKYIFDSIKKKKKYYRLKEGDFLPLNSKELNDAAKLFEYIGIRDSEFKDGKVLLPKYNALYIEDGINESNMTYVEKSQGFKSLIDTLEGVQKSEFKVPAHIDNVLRGYQKVGFKWFKTLSACGFGGILADEMGLGKTLQALAFIESELEEQGQEKGPVLIVVPTSLVYNWQEEIDKFIPSIKALVIIGSKDERDELRKTIKDYDIVITSYPLIRNDIEEYKDITFSICILDEAQYIKNPGSLNAQAVKNINARVRFALTGTPIENSLTELWSIFDFLMPGYLLSHGSFVKKYESPIIKDKDEEALMELNKHIQPFILRRFKKEVAKELPPKIEHKVIVDMTDEQKRLYASYIASAKQEVDEQIRENGFNKSKMKILALLTRLRQICCDPSSFIENYDGESGKMMALDDILEESIGSGHRILLFSQFTTVLKNIEKRLVQNNIEYLYLDGQTPSKDRLSMVNRFNEGYGDVFLISLRAGGTGLNLTGADVVIHFDPWWNPAVEEQAVDRAHRIGQNKTVQVIKLLSHGTIEEKIYDLQEKKKGIIQSVLNNGNTGDISLSNMNEEEFRELFE